MGSATNQMFLFDVELQDLRQVDIFRSGMSRPADFSGAAQAGVPVGVQILDTSARVRSLIVQHANRGGRTFIDSGAYPAFMDGTEVDFDLVLHRYEEIVFQCLRPERLTIAMPDRIGDQDGTSRLLRIYRERIRAMIDFGIDAICTLQKGERPLEEVYREVVEALGTDRFAVGLPMKHAVITEKEHRALVRKTRPRRMHFLGIGARRKLLHERIALTRQYVPLCEVTADANRLRAQLGSGRKGLYDDCRRSVSTQHTRRALRGEGLLDMSDWDETEALGYLRLVPAEQLADVLGRVAPWADSAELIRLLESDEEEAFDEYLECVPYGALLQAVEDVLAREDFEHELKRRRQTGVLRAEAIALLEQRRSADPTAYC